MTDEIRIQLLDPQSESAQINFNIRSFETETTNFKL